MFFPLLSQITMKQSLTHLIFIMSSITILLKLIQISNPPSDFPKKYYEYLPPLNIESFFVTPTDSTEVSNVISSLNQDKSDGPNSIPIKILQLLNKDIFGQLAILFNQSFSSRIFPSILKTSKIILTYKKGSKLECSNYRLISLLSNIDKILERLMYNRLNSFLEKKIYHIFTLVWFLTEILYHPCSDSSHR